MFNLEKEIKQWKRELRKDKSFEDGFIEELESHLRDEIECFIEEGLETEQAFNKANLSVGANVQLSSELNKISTTPLSLSNSWQTNFPFLILLPNYIKIALRNIRKYKSFSIINVFGLALGMACFFLIMLWVQDELDYDKFHVNNENIYRLIHEKTTSETFKVPATPPPLGSSLKNEFPEIEQFTRIISAPRTLRYGDNNKHVVNKSGYFADSNFFDVFTYRFTQGSKSNALNDINSIVISEDLAVQCFGDSDPMGRTFLFNNSIELKITGIIKIPRENSHLDFNYLLPINLAEKFRFRLDSWQSDVVRTYLVLSEFTDYSLLNLKVENAIRKHVPEKMSKILLQPLHEIHLYSLEGGGPIVYVYILSAIGVFILLIACINFMILSTAISVNRVKEIGLRKVIGARRIGLIKQFLSESILLSFLAFIIAIIEVLMFLEYYNSLTEKNILFSSILTPQTLTILVVITLLTGLFSGFYPAIYLSSLRPLNMLRSSNTIGNVKGKGFRKFLLVVQLSLSVFLIICSLVVMNQLRFLKNKSLGFDKENLVYMNLSSRGRNNFQSVKNELKQNPSILNVSQTNSPLLYLGFETSDISWEGQQSNDRMNVQIRSVDFEYLETFRMKMKSGRFFSSDFSSDSSAFILNEKAAKMMGMDSPVGKWFSIGDKRGKIIGIVGDFHHHSLNSEIEPLCFILNDKWSLYLFARIAPGKIEHAKDHIKNLWENINPGSPFNITFFEESIDGLYNNETRLSKILNNFTVIGLFISCLGLFGLVSYTVEQRKKEIGLRKVLGASSSEILLAQSKEFVLWILAANLIAWPTAFFVMTGWLENFAYRIDIYWWIFILSGITVLITSLIVVIAKTLKSAMANPIESLRYE